MSAIMAAIVAKAGWIGAGALIPIVFMLGKRFIPKYAASIFSGILGKGMANIDKLEDPKEKELVHAIALAVVKYVEFKIPDKEQGQAKFKVAAQKLCSLLPFLKGRESDMEAIIESAVAAMDAELHKIN